MTTPTEKLAACPFCGGAARIESNRDTHKLYAEHDDECIWSGSEDPVITAPATDYALAALHECWNRRALLRSQQPDQPIIPLSAIRPIAVEAIRAVTGCPDVSGNGKHLSDEMEVVAKAAAGRSQQPVSGGERELVGQRSVLAGWVAQALSVLDTLDPDDCEDSGTALRALIAKGSELVRAVRVDTPLRPSATPPTQQGVVMPDIDIEKLAREAALAICKANDWDESNAEFVKRDTPEFRKALAALVLEEAERICNSKHANGRRKYTHADECANAICVIAEGLKP